MIANSASIQSALHCLKVACTDKYASDERSSSEWKKLLQSALASIIDLTKTGCDETKVDEVTMMLAIAVFLLHTGSDVCSAPSLQYPCINHFRQCLQCENPVVKLKCIQTVRSIFANSDLKVSTPYIHALAPRIIEGLYVEKAKSPKTDHELSLILESVLTVETLIELAEPKNSKYIFMEF